MNSTKMHWETIFTTTLANERSWTQNYPTTSIDYIESLNLPKNAKIIDVGAGDSNLVDALVEKGYENIYILDISEIALQKAKDRLGNKSININWIVSDILEFRPKEKFDFWHDRAAFHFLTGELSIQKYINIVSNALEKDASFLLGTFSEDGPTMCSGLEINRYSDTNIINIFNENFNPVRCFTEAHTTPFNTKQNFLFCGFMKK